MAAKWENSTVVVVIKSFFVCLFIIAAVIGNGSVIYAVKNFIKLKTIPNYFVLNLAVADILFAVTGMPMILATTIAREWVLGDFLCNVSGFLNSLFCSVSIWTLAMISVNRYFAVAKASNIKRLYTKKRTYIIIGGTWVFSVIISMPPLIGWSEFISGSNFCTINGHKHLSYSVVLLSIDYVTPIIVLSCLYLRIFFLLRKHEKIMKRANPDSSAIDYDESSFTSENASVITDYSINRNVSKKDKNILVKFKLENNDVKSTIALDHSQENDSKEEGKIDSSNRYVDENSFQQKKRAVSIKDNHNTFSSSTVLRKKRKGSVKKFFKEARVTKMLLIVVLGFFLCWTPFIVASVMYGLGEKPDGFRLLTLGIMVACLNSVINPFIYAVMNRNFRVAFETMGKSGKHLFWCGSK